MALTIPQLEAQIGKNATQVDAADQSVISQGGVTKVITEAERIASPIYVAAFSAAGAVRPGDTIPIGNGGTGATDAAGALSALGAAAAAHSINHQQGQSDVLPLDSLGFTSDILDLNADISRHGLMPKLANDALKYINGLGTWVKPVIDTLAAGTDITTLNATTSVHGLLPKLGGGTTNFLRADGTWATPPGTGGGGGTSVANDIIWDAKGDLTVATAADAAVRLPIGSTNQVLTVVAGTAAWANAAAAGMGTDVLWDVAGDLAVGTGANTGARLPIGSNGQVLSVSGGAVTWAAPAAGGSSPFDGSLIVASNDAPASVKAAAHYTCDGTADDVQINAAILAASALNGYGGPVGGTQAGLVQLTGGRFNLAAAAKMRTGVTLQGKGRLTQLRAVGMGTASLIEANATTDHLFVVKDLWLDGNFASGGTGSGAHFVSTAGASRSTYPDVNPDPDILLDNLLITGFSNGTRYGIWCDTDWRGTMISNVQIRSADCGIFMDSSPDSHISNVHIGTINNDGFRISGGNVKLNNCKAYYCDANGFSVTSGRGSLTGCEAQDNAVGFRLSASPVTCAGLVADTSRDDGFIVSSSRTVISGFSVFHRASGRYATGTRGFTFSGTPTDCSLTGVVDPTTITTPVSGTSTGARNFVRISSGAALVSVG